MAAETTREQKVLAVTAVMRRVPEGRYRDEILAALFAEGRPQHHHHTSRPAVLVQARTAYLDEVRAWVLAERGRVLSAGQVTEEDERAYVAATGHRFVPPEPVP